MEVTKHNFEEALSTIKEQLKHADFVSFDGEFTGLGRSNKDRWHELNDTNERYEIAKKIVKEYGLLQLGLTLFRFCSTTKQYFTSTYSFFLAGDPHGSYKYDASSMRFLSQNGFDFNKLFMDGLSFMSVLDETKMREKRRKCLQETNFPSTPVLVKDENSRTFMKRAVEKISQMNCDNPTCVFPFASMNGFQRKILFKNVGPKFPNIKSKSINGGDVQFTYFESEDLKLEGEDEDWESDLKEKIGFGHVVKALLDANKPLVGHNMFSDVLHFVDKFLAPLPATLQEFKTLVEDNLPPLYDTKLIVRDPPFSTNIMNSGLVPMYNDLVMNYDPSKLDAEENCLSYTIQEDGQAHDGGYDAFMTGVSFATMVKHMERNRWSNIKEPLNSTHLKQYCNKIYLMGSYDIPYIDIEKDEDIPSRSFIYAVRCPTTWSNVNVRSLFAKLKSYKSVWVHDQLFFVIPQEDGDIIQASVILEGIRASCPDDVFVSMYDEHLKNEHLNKLISCSSPENNYKELRPVSECGTAPNESATLKRKSTASADSPVRPVNQHAEVMAKAVKRMKSVGSEALSNMSLESTTIEDIGISVVSQKGSKYKGDQPFEVPDKW